MAVAADCPTCGAHLTAPAAAAGKTVKCPKCHGGVPVPALPEFAGDEQDRPRKRASAQDEDDYDDRPRRPKRPNRAARYDDDERAPTVQNVAATDAGRRYLISATPAELGRMAPKAYLNRVAKNLPMIHKGFDIDAGTDAESAGSPAKDFTLRGEGKVKLLRMVVGPGCVYTLLVEGGPDRAPAGAT